MLQTPRFRTFLALALLCGPLAHAAAPQGHKGRKLSAQALLDLGAKLSKAIWEHESKRVDDLLKKGASPNAVGDLEAPLQRAISRDDTVIFKKLLAAGANPRVQVRDGKLFAQFVHEFGYLYGDSIPLLFEAASQRNPSYTKTLMARGADPKIVSHGITAAFVAARFDNLEVLRLLVDSLGGMSHPDSQRITDHAAVHGAFSVLGALESKSFRPDPDSLCEGLALAIKESDTSKTLAFLEHGVPLEPKNPSYHSPLLRAIDKDSRRLFELLLAKGANPNVKSKDGVSAVLLAAKKSDTTWLVRLLEQGADVNVTNADGQNSLFSAAEECIPVLLARKIKLDVVDRKGVSPLLEACKRSRWKVVEKLIQAGTDVGPISSTGESVLSQLVSEDQRGLAQMILDRGGSLNQVPPKGTTILQSSYSRRYHTSTGTLLWLLRHGANPSLPDTSGRTPVALAAKMAKWDEMALLVRFGAKDDIRPFAARLVAAAMDLDDDTLLTTLVAKGCSLDAPDTTIHVAFDWEASRITYTKEPALIQALRDHSAAKAAKLLRHGASPNVVDRDGVPALLLAIKLHEIEVVKLLLENRVDVSRTDAKNQGYRQYLASIAYPQMAELFLGKDGK